jgi:hypothetical protein
VAGAGTQQVASVENERTERQTWIATGYALAMTIMNKY